MDPEACLKEADNNIVDNTKGSVWENLNAYGKWRQKGGFEPIVGGIPGDQYFRVLVKLYQHKFDTPYTGACPMKYVTQGQITGQGKTLKAAKEDLAARILVALEGTYSPTIINHGECTGFLYRTPWGWHYNLYYKDKDSPFIKEGVNNIRWCNAIGNVPKEEAIQKVAGHIVNNDTNDYHSADEMPEWLTDKNEIDNILTCRRFNRAFQWARENSPEGRDTDVLWHEWAGWHMHEERFS